MLDYLSRLVDRSLVVAEEGLEGRARYRLLETLRQYGGQLPKPWRESLDAAIAACAAALDLASASEEALGRRPGAAQPHRPAEGLTAREQQVAALVADGLSNREIATRLFISPRTVDSKVEHIRNKLDLRSRAQIATWVAQRMAGGPSSKI